MKRVITISMGASPVTGRNCLLYMERENNLFPQNMVTVYPKIYISWNGTSTR
jgi:hypothetical protein